MDFTVALPQDLTERDALGNALQTLLQATAIINADWVMRQWDAGEKPSCCAKCQKVRYIPDRMANGVRAASSPVLFARGHGSCGEIAACHTGHKIAEAYRGVLPRDINDSSKGTKSAISWNEAITRYRVVFEDIIGPNGPRYFHAICDDDGVLIDPTQGMLR